MVCCSVFPYFKNKTMPYYHSLFLYYSGIDHVVLLQVPGLYNQSLGNHTREANSGTEGRPHPFTIELFMCLFKISIVISVMYFYCNFLVPTFSSFKLFYVIFSMYLMCISVVAKWNFTL